MKTKLTALLLISISLLLNSFNANSKVLLRLNLEKGTVYEMTMSMTNNIDQEMMGQKMKIDQKMEMVFSYQVLDVLPNANFMIEYSIRKIKLSMNMNDREMNFDSENADESNPMNKSLGSLKSMKLKVEMNPRGQVQKIEGLDLFAKEFAGNPQMAQSMSMFANDKNFGSFMSQTFNYFPEKEVDTGDKWTASFKLPAMMDMETAINFEVASVEKDQILLNVASDVNMDSPIEQGGMKMNMKITGTQNGKMAIDAKDGWLRDSDLIQKFDMHIKMTNPQSGEDIEIPVLMNSVVKTTVVKK
jgi:hypothetical protein